MTNFSIGTLICGLALFWGTGCSPTSDQEKIPALSYEKYILDNGLEVILHQDKSDPLVAVTMAMHVGSNREVPGKTGFAHFFEHMFFQKSENIPEGVFSANMDKWGGTNNGFTTNDYTTYHEVVPSDALEKVLWMESDRLGFFINSITANDLEKEKGVVQNERRQRFDNSPYGLMFEAVDATLYPENHPYHWPIIGSLEDLQNAELSDLRAFYEEYYGPNNTTLVIAGNLEFDETKALVEKYFGEIAPHGNPKSLLPKPITLPKTLVIEYEDKLATLPRVHISYPTVESMHEDRSKLGLLSSMLADGERTVFQQVIVNELGLAAADNINISSYTRELAGTFDITITVKDGVDLDSVVAAVDYAFEKFEREGIHEQVFSRVMAESKLLQCQSINTAIRKALKLSFYNHQAGDPKHLATDLEKLYQVTPEDVMRMYTTYIKDKPRVIAAWVPEGQLPLSVTGAVPATLIEEDNTSQYRPKQISQTDEALEKTPSALDRSVEPDFGPAPLRNTPSIWSESLSNGLQVRGLEYNELPYLSFSFILQGGILLEKAETLGTSGLLANLMKRGTANKTPEELEDAMGQIGMDFSISPRPNYINIEVTCLSNKYEQAMALVAEILLEPRWDEEEFQRLKNDELNRMKGNATAPFTMASKVLSKVLFGPDHIRRLPNNGIPETVTRIELEDLQHYHSQYFSPSVTSYLIDGDIEKPRVLQALDRLASEWESKEVSIPEYTVADIPTEPQGYFIDAPGASQSLLYMGRFVDSQDGFETYYKLKLANNRLGGRSLSTELNSVLREQLGYTYGAYAWASPETSAPVSFFGYTSVQANITLEAFNKFREIFQGYHEVISESLLLDSKDALIRSDAIGTETPRGLLNVLQTIEVNRFPLDYQEQQQQITKNTSLEEIKALTKELFETDRFIYVVVGDAASQLPRLQAESGLSFQLVDTEANPVN
ncbi:MAG: pitrilysin family protein [Bacteroidota bacterium]